MKSFVAVVLLGLALVVVLFAGYVVFGGTFSVS